MGSMALISPCSPIIVGVVESVAFVAVDPPPPHPINKKEIIIKMIFINPPRLIKL
tara:strand:- start:124 stop:288 length:165 start_codon:yes stop_codon:yes gene_type:complete